LKYCSGSFPPLGLFNNGPETFIYCSGSLSIPGLFLSSPSTLTYSTVVIGSSSSFGLSFFTLSPFGFGVKSPLLFNFCNTSFTSLFGGTLIKTKSSFSSPGFI